MRTRRHPKRLPHVHHSKANTRALLLAKPGVELRHAGFRSVLAAKPDWSTPQKIADHDPIGMTLADRNLVDPDGQGTRRACACELRLHVLHLQRLDGVPIKRQFLRNIRDRCLSAPAADKIGKALGVERVVCQKVEPFLLHLAAAAAIDAPHLQLKQYSIVPAGQVTHLPDLTVVPSHLDAATASTRCFFDRRFKMTMRTFGSPKTPRTVGSARNPSNEYVSQSRRRRFDGLTIHKWCQILNPAKMQNSPEIPRSVTLQALKSTHSIPRRPNYLIPVDPKIWSEEDVRRQGVSIDRLLSQLKTSGARVRLVVIEASRRNPYERRFRTYSHGLAPIQTSENALILSSAAPGQVVEDPDELHSQLMTALLTQMDSSKGIEEVFNNTRNAVVAATQGQQIPAVSSTLTESVNLWPARSGAPVSSVDSTASGRRE